MASGVGAKTTTVAGAALLLIAAGWTGLKTAGEVSTCSPPLDNPEKPVVYSLDRQIELGGPICLRIDRARFFAPERAALAELETEAAAAASDRDAARTAHNAAAERLRSADAAAKAAAQTQEQAATATLKAAEKRLSDARTALRQVQPARTLLVFVDGVKIPVEGPEVLLRPVSADKGTEWTTASVILRSTHDAESDAGKAWRQILGGPSRFGSRPVNLGVGVEGSSEEKVRVRERIPGTVLLQVFDPLLLAMGLGGLVLLAAGVGRLFWNTSLLRDGPANSPFSLGRVQMAFWLVLTVGGFLFIWLVSGQWRGVITTGIVGLLGISASTGVAARLVDAVPTTGTSVVRTKKGFWRDLVETADGVALHRVQLIVWTLVLGAVYVWSVYWTFGFPDFDANLLLLAGIASAAYVGFKFPER